MSRFTLLTVAGVPLRVTPSFVVVAGWVGWRAGQDVASVRFAAVPAMPEDPLELAAWLQTHDPMAFTTTQPSIGWVIAAALGVALVYALSVVAHELDFAGGYVEMHDDDRLTAGKHAAIVAAGPLMTALLALGAWIALRTLGWPLTDTPDLETSAGVVAGRILSSVFMINAVALAVNLLPVRPLDGGQLLNLWVSRRVEHAR